MENKPQIPTLKESKKDDKKGAPPLRIKGLQSGQSLIERLKMFKKKDLAFILSGLGVLFMAPLAEHFMMSPNQDNGTMSEGWNTPGKGGSVFGNGSSPYDPGVNGLAPGGAVGSGSDVITPLNVRDPSALVMGPGQTTQAPAVTSQPSAAPPPPPSSKDDTKWNDAINAGKAAASAATKKAALPVPHIPLSAGGLRGLGAVSGGTGASFSLPAPSSNGLASGHVNQSNGLTGTSGSGFKGVARGPNTGGTGNLEKLKQAAASAGGDFNRAGSATTALEQAANRDMGGGGSDGGSGEGGGQGDKATSGSQNKDSKSPGESLEFLRQKMQMEKDIAFADELRKNDPSCLLNFKTPCMERNKIFAQGEETLISKGLVEPIAGAMGDWLKGMLDPGAGKVFCYSKSDPSKWTQSMDKPGQCGSTTKDQGTQGYCFSGGFLTYNGGPVNGLTDVVCQGGTGDGSTAASNTQPGVDGQPQGPVTNGPPDKGGPLGDMCLSVAKLSKPDENVGAGIKTKVDGQLSLGYLDLVKASQELASVKGWASGDITDQTKCGGAGVAALGGLATSDKAVGPMLSVSKKNLRKLIAKYKKYVLAGDGSRVQRMVTMEAQSHQALASKLTATPKTAAEVDQMFAAGEQSFGDAGGILTEAQAKDKDPWQPLATGVSINPITQALDKTQQTMEGVKTGAQDVKDLVGAARAKVAASDADSKAAIEKFAKPIEDGAAYWSKTVEDKSMPVFGSAGNYFKDYSNQREAVKDLTSDAKGSFAAAHQAALAIIGTKDGAPGAAKVDGITAIGAEPVRQTLAAASTGGGGSDYRGQVAKILGDYQTKVTAAMASGGGGADAVDQLKPQVENQITDLHAKIQPDGSQKAWNEKAATATTDVTKLDPLLTDPKLGSTINESEADDAPTVPAGSSPTGK